jgi:hypothetical protein
LGAKSKNSSEQIDDFRTPPLLNNNETALVDSGCTGFILLTNAPCLNKKESSNPLTVKFPNGQTMDSTHTAYLDIPELSKAASVAHIFQPWFSHGKTTHYSQLGNYGMKATP